MKKLPFIVAPTDKIRTVGNAATGTLEIRSIGAMTALETEYFESQRANIKAHLLRTAKEAMARTGRKYKWDDVLDAVKATALSTELTIPELERTADEFSQWNDEAVARNNAIAAVAIMRGRVVGCEDMTIEQFEDDALVPIGLRAKLVEFAIDESNGWPKEQSDPDADAASANGSPVAAVSEAEAAK